MSREKISVVFMGSPEFALPSLELLNNDPMIEIIFVYTQPPKPSGRGHKEKPTIIHQYCSENGLNVRTPKSLRSEEEFNFFKGLVCDIVVVVAYGLLIPEVYLSLPSNGFINLHPSDLPKYRGAAPMHAVILNGDDESAICVMQLDAGMDSGDVLLRKKFKSINMNYEEIYQYCANEGAKMILDSVKNYSSCIGEKQDHNKVSFAPKINKFMAEINETDDLKTAINKVRAFSVVPANFIIYDNVQLKISDVSFVEIEHNEKLGLSISKNDLRFYLKDGYLLISKIQKPGRSFITAKDFINGSNL